MKNILLAAVAVFVSPLQAWAHEGHGIPGQGDTVAHYVFDPLHLPLAIIACSVLIWFAVRMRARWSRSTHSA